MTSETSKWPQMEWPIPNSHPFLQPCNTNHDTHPFSRSPATLHMWHAGPLGWEMPLQGVPDANHCPLHGHLKAFTPLLWRGMVCTLGDTELERFWWLPWGLTGTHSVPRTTPQARGSLRNRKQKKTCRKSENLRTSSSWKPINFTMCIMHSNKYHCTCGSQDLSPPKFHTSAAPRKHAPKNLVCWCTSPCWPPPPSPALKSPGKKKKKNS